MRCFFRIANEDQLNSCLLLTFDSILPPALWRQLDRDECDVSVDSVPTPPATRVPVEPKPPPGHGLQGAVHHPAKCELYSFMAVFLDLSYLITELVVVPRYIFYELCSEKLSTRLSSGSRALLLLWEMKRTLLKAISIKSAVSTTPLFLFTSGDAIDEITQIKRQYT